MEKFRIEIQPVIAQKMRNILEHPIDYDDKIEVLTRLLKKEHDQSLVELRCGDMTELVLEIIIEDIKKLHGKSDV